MVQLSLTHKENKGRIMQEKVVFLMSRGIYKLNMVANIDLSVFEMSSMTGLAIIILIVRIVAVIIFILLLIITVLYLRKKHSEKQLKQNFENLKIKKEELDYISKFDTLTKVLNRRGLYNELEMLEDKGKK